MLKGITDRLLVPPQARDEIVFNILRLDPMHRHHQSSFDRVSDLAGLWKAVDAATRRRPARAVAQTPFVRLAGQTILSGNNLMDE